MLKYHELTTFVKLRIPALVVVCSESSISVDEIVMHADSKLFCTHINHGRLAIGTLMFDEMFVLVATTNEIFKQGIHM